MSENKCTSFGHVYTFPFSSFHGVHQYFAEHFSLLLNPNSGPVQEYITFNRCPHTISLALIIYHYLADQTGQNYRKGTNHALSLLLVDKMKKNLKWTLLHTPKK